MVERILALGVSGLPNPIRCISWESVEEGLKQGQIVNISDYNIVFVDFSYFTEQKGNEHIISFCLNQNKFFEVVKSGIDLFIFGIPDYWHITKEQREFIQFYSWLPDMVKIYTTVEHGEIIKCLNKSFLDYFSLLKDWFFYYNIKQNISDKYPYLYDLNILAINNAGKKLGFEITNFRRINIKLFNDRLIAEAMGLKTNYVVETYKGKLYIIPTLKANCANGILSILKNIYNLSFSRQEPAWCHDIQTKKSSQIGNEIKKLLEDKQKIESLISQKLNDAERIEFYKQLLWQVGGELEKVVHESLKLIGLLPSPPTKADDDGVFNYNNEEFMLEIKSGLERGATFGELSKLITRIENRKKLNNKDCKGIFIMNHYANFPLKDRDKSFPKNVIETARVNNVRLVTTEQLFNIIKQVLDEEISVADAQKQLFSL